MFDYKVKIGLVPMRRNTTDRPRGASWNWHSPQEREKEIVAYIKDNFSSDNVEFVDTKGLGIGNLIFDNASQDTHSGGSGCGCSAVTLAGYLLTCLYEGEWNRILFVPAGALLSPVSANEGHSIPGIAHAIVLERKQEVR